MKRFLAILTLLLLSALPGLRAQEGAEDERVQYTLILPEEKTPELVKPEENNPFQSAVNEEENESNSTEENQVRDLLLRMPVGGAASGMKGMRVMLGGMRLEPGMEVPPVIPDQQVVLRVKAITPSAIELVWVEKKPSGLPPKLLVIPMDGSPAVRYRMPAGGPGAAPGSGGMGTMRRPDVSAFSPGRNQPAEPTIAKAQRAEPAPPPPPQAPFQSQAQTATPSPAPAAAPAPKPAAPPANTPEASVLRMLFGNHPPVSK